MSVLHIFLVLSLVGLYHLAIALPPRIRVTSKRYGAIEGQQQPDTSATGESGHKIYEFLGIKYAQTPTGNLRFKRPQPLSNEEIDKVYDATYYRPVCLQTTVNNSYIPSIKPVWPKFNSSKDMSEDCLYLNIYAPDYPIITNFIHRTCTKMYPVMVYIHGGRYVAGTPVRDVTTGEYLPRKKVILVTIQYRLGAFGFFTTGDSEAPGNLGLLDQVEALKWIQDNIEYFCGNKNSVTLFGEGTGGSSVSLHYLSSLSKGLFHRGIAVSGNALTPFALKPKSTVLKASKTLIRGLGCEKQNSQLTVQCLRNKSSNAIIKNNKDALNVQPFVDSYFLQDEPRKLLKEGKFHGQTLPLISGFVTNEGTNGISEPNTNNIDDYKNYLEKQFIQKNFNFTKQQAPIAFDALAFEYTPWEDLKTPEAFEKNVIDMLSDYTVIAPTHAVLSFHGDHGANAYMFEVTYRSSKNTGPKWKGVSHERILAYIFGLPRMSSPKTNLKFDLNDIQFSIRMVHLFTYFAEHNIAMVFNGLGWPVFDTNNKYYLQFLKLGFHRTRNYHPSRMGFWNSYFPTLFPCVEHEPWYGQCKKNEAPKPSQSPNGVESNPATLLDGSPNTEIVLW